MSTLASPLPARSTRRDPWLLLLAAAIWSLLARWQPIAGIALPLALGSTLSLCKALRMPPVRRAFIAPLPVVAMLPWLGTAGRPGLFGALLAAGGYLAFTLTRRCAYALRYYSHRTPDGRRDGLDRGRLLLLHTRLRQKLHPAPPRRILFSTSVHEAGIRESFALGGDTIHFSELDAAHARDYDLVVPLTIPALLQSHALGLASGNPLPIPSANCIALCDDKLRFHHALVSRGFGDLLPPLVMNGVFPSVLKKRLDEWGAHSYILLSEGDERSHAGLLDDPDYFRQAYVSGRREYASHLLMRDGHIQRSLTIEYRFDHDHYVKGSKRPPRDIRVVPSMHLEDFSAMLAAIDFEGLCCVNYKLRDNRPLVLEVNPRFGASLAPYLFSFLRNLECTPGRGDITTNATTSAANPTIA